MSSSSFAASAHFGNQNDDDNQTCSHKYEPKKRDLEATIAAIKKKRTRFLTADQKLDVAYLFYSRKLNVLRQNAKNPRRRPKAANAQKFTVDHLGYGSTVVAAVTKEYKLTSRLSDSVNTGNSTPKQTRVPVASRVIVGVRNYVRERRQKLQRTVAKDVLSYLVGENIVTFDSNNKKDYDAVLRSVQRFLIKVGYQRGKKKGGFAIKEKEDLINKRNGYLEALISNRMKPPTEQLREVYLDESYVHHHYKRTEESIYDPNDEQDLVVRELHKGQRYCFASAIQGPDPRYRGIPNSSLGDDNKKAGVVPGTNWIFEGKNTVKDYHATFNSTTFLNWWNNQLLPNLKQPSLIIMDNASYHKSPRPDAPKFNTMKMAAMRSYLSTHGVQYPSDANRPELVNLCNTNFPEELLPATVRAAAESGHKVLFTPPYHSDLQPIELVWAHIKGEVGRKYQQGISFQQVLQSLNLAFTNLAAKHDTIAAYIEKSYECAMKFTKNGQVDQDEVADNAEEGCDGGSAAMSDDEEEASGDDEDTDDEDEWDSDDCDSD